MLIRTHKATNLPFASCQIHRNCLDVAQSCLVRESNLAFSFTVILPSALITSSTFKRHSVIPVSPIPFFTGPHQPVDPAHLSPSHDHSQPSISIFTPSSAKFFLKKKIASITHRRQSTTPVPLMTRDRPSYPDPTAKVTPRPQPSPGPAPLARVSRCRATGPTWHDSGTVKGAPRAALHPRVHHSSARTPRLYSNTHIQSPPPTHHLTDLILSPSLPPPSVRSLFH